MTAPKPSAYRSKVKAYWDDVHTKNDRVALTGATLARHCEILGVSVVQDSKVLCIGIGRGQWVRDLAKVATVSVLDISTIALGRVPMAASAFTTPDELPQNVFDLAMSLWVAPHMSDPDLQQQLTGVIRSLTVGGVFAIHYNEPLDEDADVDNRCGCDDEPERVRLAAMLRRRGQFVRMVECSGGQVLGIVREHVVESCRMQMVTAHVAREANTIEGPHG